MEMGFVFFEAAGERKIYLAASQQRQRGLDAGTVVDVAGRH
jgi:hypothetical protein